MQPVLGDARSASLQAPGSPVTEPRHSILVGASKGIGRVLARSLALAGHKVTVLARTAPEGIGGVSSHSIDLADVQAVTDVIARLRTEPAFSDLVFLAPQLMRSNRTAAERLGALVGNIDGPTTLAAERAYLLPLHSMPNYYVANRDLAFVPHTDTIVRFYEMSWK